MLKFAPYVLKNLLRQRTRSLLTVSGTAVALFVFVFIAAAGHGLGAMTDERSERTLIVFQANRFCPNTSRLPEDYAAAIRAMPGVKDVVPIQAFMNNCRASLDLVLFHGVPAQKLRSVRDLSIVAGDWHTFEQHTDGALVGRVLAARRGLRPGQKFTMGEITVSIAGIFSAATPAEENLLYCHLEFLQRVRGSSGVGVVTQHEVHLQDSAAADAIARQIDGVFRSDRVATDTRTKGVFQASVLGDVIELVGLANYLAYACLALVFALVATTTVMAVQDRVREHALLQIVGYSGPRLFWLVLAEGMIVSLVGGIVGVGLAMLSLWWLNLTVGAEGVTIALTPSVTLAVQGLLAAAVVGMASGVAPAWQAASAEPVSALRQA